MRKNFFVLVLFPVAIGMLTFGVRGQLSAQIKYKPEVPYPDEAKATHLEGTVSVPIVVVKSGKVFSVGEPEGPDGICPRISTPGVKAMRSLAAKAAEKTLLDPTTLRGDAGEWHFRLSFTFKHPTLPADSIAPKADPAPDGLRTGALMISKDQAALPAELGQQPKIISGGVLNGHAKKLAKPNLVGMLAIAGRVDVWVVIDEKGKVYRAQAISGYADMGAVARLAACESEFAPTLLDGKPVKVSGVITYNFK
jgi:outer membrane biosynthesis protein TonB